MAMDTQDYSQYENSLQGSWLRSKAISGGTDQTYVIQNEINSINTFGGGTLILPLGTIIATIVMKHRVSIQGQGKGSTVLKPPVGSTALGCITLPVGPVTNAWIKNLSVQGNGNAGQHGIFFQSQGQAVGNNGGWWNSGLESVLVSGFTGDQIWLMGGGTNALTPHQFLTFKDVEAYIPSGGIRVALRMTGQVGQVSFLGHCEFDGPGQSNPGTNVDIRRQTDINLVNLSDEAPYTINFLGTTFQNNQSGVHVERAAQVTFDRCHLETISQGFSVDTSAVGIFLNEVIFGTVGVNAGNGYAVKASSSSSVYALNNVFTSTPDKHFISSSAYLIQRGTVTSSGAPPITSGLTPQYSIAGDGSLSTGLNTQAVVNGSATQLITLTSGLGPGETLTIKAITSSIVINSTGNIDPAGKTMPYTLPAGASITFQKQDLLGTPWFIQAVTV